MTLDGDGLSFSNKTTPTKRETLLVAVDCGVKLQLPKTDHHQSVPFNTIMVFHHTNQDRPLIPSKGISSDHGGVNFGPTSCDRNKSMMINYSNDIYYSHVGVGHGDSTSTGSGICGGSVGARTLQQPFDNSETTSTSAFKSPGGMAATLRFPFTNAQWKELERQAMIYKYMMASIPVPPQLLCPAAASHSPLGGGLNLRFANGTNLEPGRCRRTDGKKWRCLRDAAPDQKYCERHMHRGKPRSRKPVELNANTKNKKTRPNPAIFTESPATVAISYNNNIINNGSAASQFGGATPHSSLKAPVILDKSCNKVVNFDANVAFVSAYKDPRNLDWNMVKEPDRQWQHLVPTEIGLATESSFINQQYQEQSLNLNSFGNFGGGGDQESNECTIFLDETPGGFIGAWSSRGASDGHNAGSRNRSSVSSNGKLCLSPLSLSMGGNKSMDDGMGQIKMGLGLMESDQKHDTSTPGGPLAEVLQLGTGNNGTATINRSSSVVENGESSSTTPATTVSSPSVVLQKTMASFSDSSGNSSPKLASSRARSTQIDLLWLNQC